MNRSPLRRNARLKSKTTLRRKTRIRTVNKSNKTNAYARNFGDEADRVRAMACIIRGADGRVRVVPAHNPSRGAGGGRFDIVPMGTDLHDLQHSMGVETFQARYGVNLRAEADRVALEHPRPLGIRGLADRWLEFHERLEGGASHFDPEDMLDDYEEDALLGWVRRRMALHLLDLPDGAEHRLALDLGIDPGQARALVEAAS